MKNLEKWSKFASGVTAEQISQPTGHQIPKNLQYTLYTLFIAGGIVSFPFLGRGGPLPMTLILDIWIVIFAAYCFLSTRIETTFFLLFLSLYTLTRAVPAISNETHIYDFLQAYRWLFYLFVLALAIGKAWGSIKPLIISTWLLLVLAIVKSALTLLLMGTETRPGLLLENNFEIALFSGLLALIYRHLGSYKFLSVFALGTLTILAGSRSGIIAFIIFALYALFELKRINIFGRYLAIVMLSFVGLLAARLFSRRAEIDGQIDRLNFLEVFLWETESWGVFNWLFGTSPITALSPDSCHTLGWYSALFSSAGDGTCYVVILHAFLLRVVFDTGLFGLMLVFGSLFYLMKISNVEFSLSVCLIGIAITNSMSVSGPNNPYVILPILLAILLTNNVNRTKLPLINSKI